VELLQLKLLEWGQLKLRLLEVAASLQLRLQPKAH